MGVLVEDLLTLARLDEVRDRPAEAVDVAQLAEDAAADARAVDPARAIEVEAGDEAIVLGDANQLRQVLANLLGNALVHTPAGTPIEIAVRRNGDARSSSRSATTARACRPSGRRSCSSASGGRAEPTEPAARTRAAAALASAWRSSRGSSPRTAAACAPATRRAAARRFVVSLPLAGLTLAATGNCQPSLPAIDRRNPMSGPSSALAVSDSCANSKRHSVPRISPRARTDRHAGRDDPVGLVETDAARHRSDAVVHVVDRDPREADQVERLIGEHAGERPVGGLHQPGLAVGDAAPRAPAGSTCGRCGRGLASQSTSLTSSAQTDLGVLAEPVRQLARRHRFPWRTLVSPPARAARRRGRQVVEPVDRGRGAHLRGRGHHLARADPPVLGMPPPLPSVRIQRMRPSRTALASQSTLTWLSRPEKPPIAATSAPERDQLARRARLAGHGDRAAAVLLDVGERLGQRLRVAAERPAAAAGLPPSRRGRRRARRAGPVGRHPGAGRPARRRAGRGHPRPPPGRRRPRTRRRPAAAEPRARGPAGRERPAGRVTERLDRPRARARATAPRPPPPAPRSAPA